jgi:hypothetical protein
LILSQPDLEAENDKDQLRTVIASIGRRFGKLSSLIPTARQHMAGILNSCHLL